MPIPAPIRARVERCQILVLDFDGVMTDNSVLVSQDGRESVLCNRSDGLGLGILRDAGFPIVVLSMEENPVVKARCDKLKIPCTQGEKSKGPALAKILAERGIAPADAAYVGNDANDVPCFKLVGLAIAVADAHPCVKPHVHAFTKKPGGKGAVREVVDWFLKTRGVDPYDVRTIERAARKTSTT